MEAAPGQRTIAPAGENPHFLRLCKGIAAGADFVPDVLLHDSAVGQFDGQRLQVAVAADDDAHLAAGGNLPEQAPQLLGALDRLPVQLQHHVVDLQPDLPGRSVVVDQRNDSAARFLEFEGLRLLVIDVGKVHAEIALGAGMQQQQRCGLLEELRDLACLRRCHWRRHRHR